MTNSSTFLRAIIVYSVCLPLAVFLGYMVASPLTWTTFGTVMAILFALSFPLLLRFHHPLLVLGWNAAMIVFFLPGAPRVWMSLAALSLAISVFHRTIDQKFRFISVPELTRPLIALAIVVLITAEATGGIKLRSLGGELYGGKKYIILLAGIAAYFALTARRIPPQRAGLYIALFVLGGLTTLIGDIFYFAGSSLQFIYWLFPPTGYVMQETSYGMIRFAGFSTAALVLFTFMLARYEIREIISLRHPLRFAFFLVFVFASLLGGFRSAVANFVVLFGALFFLQGLHRTKLLPALLLILILIVSVTLPFMQRLPYSVQRAVSFLPIPVDPAVRVDAEASTEWRLKLWKAMLPQVPQYLLLGKGLALTPQDFDFSLSTYTGTMKAMSSDQSWAALAGDYHSGPLSVIIPFGIWGAAAFFWLLVAGCRVLYRNYKYGDPALKTYNTFLLAAFIGRIVIFFFIFGALDSDIQGFVGYLGMSVCLNGGVARPAPQSVPDASAAPAFARMAPRPRRALG